MFCGNRFNINKSVLLLGDIMRLMSARVCNVMSVLLSQHCSEVRRLSHDHRFLLT